MQSNRIGPQEGKVTGRQAGLAQDRDRRLRIRSPSALPGKFLGKEAPAASLEGWWERVVLESVRPLPNPPPSLPASQSGCSHFPIHKSHRERPGFPGVSEKERKTRHPLLPSLFSASSSLGLVWGDQLLPGVPRHTDIGEPNPQERRGGEPQTRSHHRTSSCCGQSFRRSPHPQPGVCANVKALEQTDWVPVVFYRGKIFGLSKSRFSCPQSEGENINLERR